MNRTSKAFAMLTALGFLLSGISAVAQQTAGAFATAFSGFVIGVTVTNGGSGYSAPPGVSFVGGGGSGAKAYSSVSSGMVTSITVTNAGFGYTNAPLVIIDPPPTTPFGSSLVLDLPLDGSVVDVSTNHFFVTNYNSGVFVTNRFGQAASALSLNGVNQNVALPFNALLYPNEFTLSLWVNFQSLNGAIWRTTSPSGDNLRGHQFIFPGGGTLRYSDYDGSGTSAQLLSPVTTVGQWYHIAISRRTNSCVFYLNGINVASQTNLTAYAKPQVSPMDFGSDQDFDGSFFSFCQMILDTIHIYNRALSDAEVQTLYAGESLLTNSPVIVSQPGSQTVASGNNAIFTVGATGYPELGYQWWNQSGVILGATNSTMTLTNVQLTNSGNYYVLVTNLYGSATSSNATLTVTNQSPFIVTQPTNRTVVVGTTATFTALAGGSLPLSYQWFFTTNTLLAGATNNSLTLSNVPANQAGTYSVRATNLFGSVFSTNAILTVTFPTPTLRALDTNAMAGTSVTVPIVFGANGIENTMGFSVNFSTQRLAFAAVTWGAGFAGANLLVNTNQVVSGRVGFGITFPPGTTFTAGTQDVVRISFNSLPFVGSPAFTSISFGDQPVTRELYNAQLQSLPVNYTSGTVTLTQTIFESDVFPRTNGNQSVTTTDWAQMGRFVARLDTAVGAEFQRADCAPRTTSGDGQMKVTDWVQSGRYVAGSDPLAAIGGPTDETAPVPPASSGSRLLKTTGTNVLQGETAEVSVVLDAQGNENALGFTLTFDPVAATYGDISLGNGATGASLTVNDSQIALGRLGVVLALPTGNNFSAGSHELVRADFLASPNVNGSFPFSLTDNLVVRCISDSTANELPVGFVIGTVGISSPNPNPELTISLMGGSVVLSWPLWAADFSLQALEGNIASQNAWTNTTAPLQTNGLTVFKSLPLAPDSRFFRLFHP